MIQVPINVIRKRPMIRTHQMYQGNISSAGSGCIVFLLSLLEWVWFE
jgi:hypothetical protein